MKAPLTPQAEELILHALSGIRELSSVTITETVHGPSLRVPSGNPQVFEPLQIELHADLSIYWYRGYFFDFPWSLNEQIEQLPEFLRRFFAEEIVCTTIWCGDHVGAGGPQMTSILGDDPVAGLLVGKPGDVYEIRSWLGTYDRDVLIR